VLPELQQRRRRPARKMDDLGPARLERGRSAAGLAAQLEAIAGRLSGVYVEHADALDVIAR